MKVIQLLHPRVCSCGKIHTEIPENHQYLEDPDFGGYYWNCSCGSTLFEKDQKAA